VQVVEQLRQVHIDGKVNKEDFARVVRCTLGHPVNSSTVTFSKDKVDVLYRVLDTDKDGFLELNELERHHAALMQGIRSR
jgi:selenocysteine lyase/cysteine desulfurase